MCMEDVLLGRKIATRQVNIIVPTVSTPVIDRSPRRVILTFFPPSAGTMTLQMVGIAAIGTGIPLSVGDHPISLNIKEHGDCVTKDWFAIHSLGGVNLNIIEGLLDL